VRQPNQKKVIHGRLVRYMELPAFDTIVALEKDVAAAYDRDAAVQAHFRGIDGQRPKWSDIPEANRDAVMRAVWAATYARRVGA
jgi:hypothetical protein